MSDLQADVDRQPKATVHHPEAAAAAGVTPIVPPSDAAANNQYGAPFEDAHYTAPKPAVSALPPRLPGVSVASDMRGHLLAVLGEFFGTFFFLWPSYVIAQIANQYEALQMQSGSQPSHLVMIAFGFGFSFFVAFLLFSRFSGGNLNPAVTLTLMVAGKLNPLRGVLMWLTQIISAMAAGGAASAMTPGPVTFANGLGGNCSRSRGLFIEVFSTILLCTAVLFLGVEKYAGETLTGIGLTIALFIGHMMSIYYTGAGINPARSFGAAVAARSFPNYHWIYWVGPAAGALISVAIWRLFKLAEGTGAEADARMAEDV